MICPCCKKKVECAHFSCQMASKGGSAKSEAKTIANRKNAQARWDKVKKPPGKVIDALVGKPKPKSK